MYFENMQEIKHKKKELARIIMELAALMDT
jgi:hypothetical protein